MQYLDTISAWRPSSDLPPLAGSVLRVEGLAELVEAIHLAGYGRPEGESVGAVLGLRLAIEDAAQRLTVCLDALTEAIRKHGAGAAGLPFCGIERRPSSPPATQPSDVGAVALARAPEQDRLT